MKHTSLALLLITTTAQVSASGIGFNWPTIGAFSSPVLIAESLYIWHQYKEEREALEQRVPGLIDMIRDLETEAAQEEKKLNNEDSTKYWTVFVRKPIVYEMFLGKESAICKRLKRYIMKENISFTCAFFSGFLGVLSCKALLK